MSTKTCTRCNEEKPLTEFSVRLSAKDGRSSRCLVCRGAVENKAAKERRRLKKVEYVPAPGHARCSSCNLDRPHADFRVRGNRLDSPCRNCRAASKRTQKAREKARVYEKARYARWKEENSPVFARMREQQRLYRAAHPDTEETRRKNNARRKVQRAALDDVYVKNLLAAKKHGRVLKATDIPQELAEVKRLELQIKRTAYEQRK